MCYFSAVGHSREARQDEALIVPEQQPHGFHLAHFFRTCLHTVLAGRPELKRMESALCSSKETRSGDSGCTQEVTAMFETYDWWWPFASVVKNGRRCG